MAENDSDWVKRVIEPALIHYRAGRIAEAAQIMQDLLIQHPENPQLWASWTDFLTRRRRSREALTAAQRAKTLDPLAVDDNLLFHLSLEALDVEGAVRVALACAETAPENSAYWSRWLLHLHYLPLPSALISNAHRNWGSRHPDPGRTFSIDRNPSRRLRIGYVSPFRSEYSVQYFLNPLFPAHAPSQVEVFAYQTLREGDCISDTLKSKADHWIETADLNDGAFAEQILSDKIDVLVDLTGHSWNNRLEAMALRLAPVQVTWLGYPGTTGLPAMDLRITDAVADPPGAESDHTERLVRIPGGFLCYQAPDQAPAVAPSPCAKNTGVTFGSMNVPVKLSEPTLALWAGILQACPGSRLVLKFPRENWPDLGENIAARLERLGIASDRLGVLPCQATFASHLSAYGLIDIALDPFPYNGTTTTCEALWMGVPVIALRGDRHAARVSASILTQVGLEELIGDSEADYLAKAVALARDPQRILSLRSGMRKRMMASPLMDAGRFARAMETVYRQEWAEWCRSLS